MAYSPPLPLGLTAWALRSSKGTPFVLNVQDLFPQSIIDLGLLKNRWIIRMFESMERFLYRQANAITVHSEGNRRHIVAKGANQDKVRVIPNWVDMAQIQPSDRNNAFRQRYNLNDAFIVSFAGVLGYSQDLDIVLDAAAILRDHPNIVWLIVGDGVEKCRLESKAKEMSLSNVRFLPMQPRDEYPAILHASDICLTAGSRIRHMAAAKRNRPGLVDDGLDGLTYQVIGLAMAVHNDLGPGHREETYHNAAFLSPHQ